MTPKLFDHQVAVITGAGVGIGFEIARQLSLQGASVVLNDMNPALAAEASAKITTQGGTCHPMAGDASQVAFIRKMVQFAADTYGRLDIAIANAGITTYGDFFEYTEEKFQRLIAVNLQGSFFLTQAAAWQMRRQNSGGRILLMSSVTGVQAHEYLAAYGMTKAGLQMLAKSLVIELSPHHISINALAPGATITERTLQDDPNYEKVWQQITPSGRACKPEDIAQAALFLVSPQAVQVTGQTLVVDGGWTATSPKPNLDFVK